MSEKPTYESIVEYAYNEGLIGKVDTVKFYDYYNKQNFMYRGVVMNWKEKLHEWAAGQRSKVTQSAKEANALASLSSAKSDRSFQMDGRETTNLKEYLAYIKQVMGAPA